MMTASSPHRPSTSMAFSPKLSPISHASSTTRQQEQRYKRQDTREPPSPFSPKSDKKPQQQQQQQKKQQPSQQEVDHAKASSNDTKTGSTKSPSELKTRVRESTESANDAPVNDHDEDDDEDYVDLTDLFVFLERRNWEKAYAFLKSNPKSSRQTIHSKKGTTPLLHIVLRHGPPLPVVNILLLQEAANDKAPLPVWKRTDTHGRLPLHAACSCGPAASLDVVSGLISADPDALQVRTKDQHGRYPLHLAVVTNASEEVVMELMIHYPDASFMPDSHGKIPIEYAQDACYGHNRLVVALEWAPMFLAASQAAFKRIAEATENKLNSLREAHASYEEQLEERYNKEKMELVREQIRYSNELGSEKERNIALAEAMLAMKESEEKLIREKDLLASKLERELALRKSRAKERDEELKQILLGKNENLVGENEDDSKKDDQTVSSVSSLSGIFDASSAKLPLPRLLKRISEGYENSKRRNELYKKSLDRQRTIARNLNSQLADKEIDLQQANRKSRCKEISLQEAIDRAEDLAQKHQSALEELSIAKDEVERLQKIGAERERRYSHTQRRLKIQEKRLSGVQDLIDSLKAAKAMAADRLDLIQEEEEEEEESERNKIRESSILDSNRSTSTVPTSRIPSINKPNAADLSFDLSVEIEMAAMAAAQLQDGSIRNVNDSICSSPSTRCRVADLSLELAGTSEREGGIGSNKENTLQKQTKNWGKNKGGKLAEGTPQTLTDTTATTASSGEDVSEDGSMETITIIPETPPVPKELRSRSRQEYDQCSPLSTMKLDFGENS